MREAINFWPVACQVTAKDLKEDRKNCCLTGNRNLLKETGKLEAFETLIKVRGPLIYHSVMSFTEKVEAFETPRLDFLA